MKRDGIFAIVLTALAGFFPTVTLLLALFDYEILMKAPLAIAIISSVLFCSGFAALQIKPAKSGGFRFLFGLLPLICLVNTLFCMVLGNSVPVTVLCFVQAFLAVILMLQKLRTITAKVTVSILFSLGVMLLMMLGFLHFTFGQIGRWQTVTAAVSPEGTYRAEVIDDDQGGLGGNTVVQVFDAASHLDLFLLEVQKKPRTVYWGEWGEFETMTLSWQLEQTLLINGTPYQNPFS